MRKILVGVIGRFAVLVVIGAAVGCGPSGSSPTPGGAAPENAGQVIFGLSVDASTMTVATPITTAKLSDKLGWIAYLSDSAKTTSLTLTVGSVTSGGAESVVATVAAPVSNPQFNQFAHQPDNAIDAYGAGTFTLRYIRPSDGTVLATGTITLTP